MSEDQNPDLPQEPNDGIKQSHSDLSSILEKATFKMFLKEYDGAILLYEEALGLIEDSDSHEISQSDICAIEFALSRCYGKQKKYFYKALDRLIPLVVAYGLQFPLLYLALAELCYKKRSYERVHSIIKNARNAVAEIDKGRSLIMNWPGSAMEIYESNIENLLDQLKLLEMKCRRDSILDNMKAENWYSDACYQSDGSSEAVEVEMELSLPDPISKQPSKGNNTQKAPPAIEDELLSDIDVIMKEPTNLVEKETVTKFKNKNDDKVENKISPKPSWKIDAPEFVPRNLSFSNPLELEVSEVAKTHTTLSCPAREETNDARVASNLPASLETKTKAIVCNKGVQTENSEFVDKSTQINQGENMEPLKQLIASIHSYQQQIQDLQTELMIQKEKYSQLERSKLLFECAATVDTARMEVKAEEFEKANQLLRLENKELKKQADLLQLSLVNHFNQFYRYHRQLSINHIRHCESMLGDLQRLLKHLTPSTFPTFEECQRQISRWENELCDFRKQAQAQREFFEKADNNRANGDFSDIFKLFDLAVPRCDLEDIFHSSLIALINNSIKEQQYKHQQQYQYSTWYNAPSRYQQHMPVPAPISGPPNMYYYPQQANNASKNPDADEDCSKPQDAGRDLSLASISSAAFDDVDDQSSGPDVTEIREEPEEDDSHSCSSVGTLKHMQGSSTVMETGRQEQENTDSACGGVETAEQARSKTPAEKLLESYEQPGVLEVNSLNKTWWKNDKVKVKTDIKKLQNEWARKVEGEDLEDLIDSEPVKESNQNEQVSYAKFLASKLNQKMEDEDFADQASGFGYSPKVSNDKKEPEQATGGIAKVKCGPKFFALLTHVKSHIPEKSEYELFHVLKAVRAKRGKLTGLGRPKIVEAVRAELECEALLQTVDASPTTCVICIETFEEDLIRTLECGHTFHIDCINQWLVTRSTCPLCQMHIFDIEGLPKNGVLQ